MVFQTWCFKRSACMYVCMHAYMQRVQYLEDIVSYDCDTSSIYLEPTTNNCPSIGVSSKDKSWWHQRFVSKIASIIIFSQEWHQLGLSPFLFLEAVFLYKHLGYLRTLFSYACVCPCEKLHCMTDWTVVPLPGAFWMICKNTYMEATQINEWMYVINCGEHIF